MSEFTVRTILPFEKQAKRLLKKYPSLSADIVSLSKSLEQDPTQGVSLGKGCYKVRMAISSKGQGKSGGARVITYVKITDEDVFLLTIYDKADKDSLEPDELAELLALLPDEPQP